MSWVAIGVSVASMAISYGVSESTKPTAPNLGAASKKEADMEAALLPIRRQLEQAAQQGTSTSITMPAHMESTEMATSILPGWKGRPVPYVASEWAKGGKYNPDGTTPKPTLTTVNRRVPAGPKTIDFSGYGTADVQSAVAKELAGVKLALAQKYDSQFIDEARKEAQLADPESFAARAKQIELTQKQATHEPQFPVADMLQSQVQSELDASKAGRLDDVSKTMLDRGVAAATGARGGGGPTADFADPLLTGFEGTRRKMAAQQKGESLQSSGLTAEDRAYRKASTDISNEGAIAFGQTPLAQFQQLSGGQQGPTPFTGAQPGAQMSNIGATQAAGPAMTNWQQNLTQAGTQTSGWMAGLTGLLGAANVAAGAGWQPMKA